MPETPAQTWNPATYAQNARFVSDLGEPLIELLAPAAGERILDLGCGDGALTAKLAALGCVVVGVDASEAQVRATHARGLRSVVCQVEALPFVERFDAVFSNAVLHWVRDQHAALECIARALRPGGRFVAEFGGFGCVDHIRRALHEAVRHRGVDPLAIDPWYFPTDDEYGALLHEHGFAVETLSLFARPTPLPGEMSAWLETFAQPFLAAIAGEEKASVVDEVTERVKPVLFQDKRGWTADYVRLRLRVIRAS